MVRLREPNVRVIEVFIKISSKIRITRFSTLFSTVYTFYHASIQTLLAQPLFSHLSALSVLQAQFLQFLLFLFAEIFIIVVFEGSQ